MNGETRAIPPKTVYLMEMARTAKGAEHVSSLDAIKSQVFDGRHLPPGFETSGVATCTAVGGYYFKEGALNLFMSHLQPLTTPKAVFGRLDLDGVHEIMYKPIFGPKTSKSRNELLEREINEFFSGRNIVTHEMPAPLLRSMKAPDGMKVHSYGAVLKLEKSPSDLWMPVLHSIEEI